MRETLLGGTEVKRIDRGIGLALAKELSARGHSVVATARRTTECEELGVRGDQENDSPLVTCLVEGFRCPEH